MGFGKAFGFGLLAFIGLNFLFVIISFTISGDLNQLFADIGANPLILLLIMFGPIANLPGTVFTSIYTNLASGITVDTLITNVGYFLTPFIAALIAGRTGDSKGGCFGGWFLISLISAIALVSLVFINPSTLAYYGITVTGSTVPLLIIYGVVNGIFYGCFALLFAKTEYY